MGCWGELKSLRSQSVGEVSALTCGNESQPGLQLVQKLATPLVTAQMLRKCRICLKGT